MMASGNDSSLLETFFKKKKKKKHKDRDLFLYCKKSENTRKMADDVTLFGHVPPLLETPVKENGKKKETHEVSFLNFGHSEDCKNSNFKKKNKSCRNTIDNASNNAHMMPLEGGSFISKIVDKKKKKHIDKNLVLSSNQLINYNDENAKVLTNLISFDDSFSSKSLAEKKRQRRADLLDSFPNSKYTDTCAVSIANNMNITDSNVVKNTDVITSGNNSSLLETLVKKKKKNKHKDKDLYCKQTENKNADASKMTGDVTLYKDVSPLSETSGKEKRKENNEVLFSHFKYSEDCEIPNFKKKSKSRMNTIDNSRVKNSDVITLEDDSSLLKIVNKKKKEHTCKDLVLNSNKLTNYNDENAKKND